PQAASARSEWAWAPRGASPAVRARPPPPTAWPASVWQKLPRPVQVSAALGPWPAFGLPVLRPPPAFQQPPRPWFFEASPRLWALPPPCPWPPSAWAPAPGRTWFRPSLPALRHSPWVLPLAPDRALRVVSPPSRSVRSWAPSWQAVGGAWAMGPSLWA